MDTGAATIATTVEAATIGIAIAIGAIGTGTTGTGTTAATIATITGIAA